MADRHTGLMEIEPELTATYFDAWYADMVGSVAKDEIQQRQLGLPAHLLSTSLLSWEGIAEVVEALGLSRGDTLLDLACGRGGYGLEIATRTGARLEASTSPPRRCARPASTRSGATVSRTSTSGTWLRPDWTPAQSTRSCASMPSSSPNRQTRRTARCGESGPGWPSRADLLEPVDRLDDRLPVAPETLTSLAALPPPDSLASRCANAPPGGPRSRRCGRKPQPSTPATTQH